MVKNTGEFNFLSIIIDINEIFWSKTIQNNDSFTLNDYTLTIISFCNAYLIENPLNHLAIIATSTVKTKVLFNTLSDIKFGNATIELANNFTNFKQLHKLKEEVIRNLKSFFSNTSDVISNGTFMSSPILHSLCVINKFSNHLDNLGQNVNSRILIIKTEGDAPNQYVDLMNSIFAAQKLNVIIDACIVGIDSDIIHQATFMTGGEYFVMPHHRTKSDLMPYRHTNVINVKNGNDNLYLYGLLQTLLWLFLPSPHPPGNESLVLANYYDSPILNRQIFNLPSEPSIDFRAVCFCHRDRRKYLDIGFVCSSCLAVFCTYMPSCQMCNAHFKLPTTRITTNK